MDSKELKAELKLTRKLLDLVNSKEEYEFLKKEEARLSSLLSSSYSNKLKGGTRENGADPKRGNKRDIRKAERCNKADNSEQAF